MPGPQSVAVELGAGVAAPEIVAVQSWRPTEAGAIGSSTDRLCLRRLSSKRIVHSVDRQFDDERLEIVLPALLVVAALWAQQIVAAVVELDVGVDGELVAGADGEPLLIVLALLAVAIVAVVAIVVAGPTAVAAQEPAAGPIGVVSIVGRAIVRHSNAIAAAAAAGLADGLLAQYRPLARCQTLAAPAPEPFAGPAALAASGAGGGGESVAAGLAGQQVAACAGPPAQLGPLARPIVVLEPPDRRRQQNRPCQRCT